MSMFLKHADILCMTDFAYACVTVKDSAPYDEWHVPKQATGTRWCDI